MSDMRDLLESMNKFAGQAVGQRPGDQVRGTEKAKPSKKSHPFKGRLVGGESADGVAESVEIEIREAYDQYVSEYGASGSGIGNDVGVTPQEMAAGRMQKTAQKKELAGQVQGLVAQVNGARAQIAQLNRTFPQGANPVEKAMALKDIQGQRIGLQGQIEDLTSQIAALRSQML